MPVLTANGEPGSNIRVGQRVSGSLSTSADDFSSYLCHDRRTVQFMRIPEIAETLIITLVALTTTVFMDENDQKSSMTNQDSEQVAILGKTVLFLALILFIWFCVLCCCHGWAESKGKPASSVPPEMTQDDKRKTVYFIPTTMDGEECAAMKRKLEDSRTEILQLHALLSDAQEKLDLKDQADETTEALITRGNERLYAIEKRYDALAARYKVVKQLDQLSEITDAELETWLEQFKKLLPQALRKKISSSELRLETQSLLAKAEEQLKEAGATCDERLRSLQRQNEKLKRQLAEARTPKERQESCGGSDCPPRHCERDHDEVERLRKELEKEKKHSALMRQTFARQQQMRQSTIDNHDKISLEGAHELQQTNDMAPGSPTEWLKHLQYGSLNPGTINKPKSSAVPGSIKEPQICNCKDCSCCYNESIRSAAREELDALRTERKQVADDIIDLKKREAVQRDQVLEDALKAEDLKAGYQKDEREYQKDILSLQAKRKQLEDDTHFVQLKREQLGNAARELDTEMMLHNTRREDHEKNALAYESSDELQKQIVELKQHLEGHEALVDSYNQALDTIREYAQDPEYPSLRERTRAYHKRIQEQNIEIQQLQTQIAQLREAGSKEHNKLREAAAGIKQVKYEQCEKWQQREPALQAWVEEMHEKLVWIASKASGKSIEQIGSEISGNSIDEIKMPLDPNKEYDMDESAREIRMLMDGLWNILGQKAQTESPGGSKPKGKPREGNSEKGSKDAKPRNGDGDSTGGTGGRGGRAGGRGGRGGPRVGGGSRGGRGGKGVRFDHTAKSSE